MADTCLDATDWFAPRHIGPSADEREAMLEAVGAASLDALIDEAYTLDETSRKETFCGIADYINEEVPLIHLFTVPNAEAYSARITGVQSTVNDLVTWNIADWTVK